MIKIPFLNKYMTDDQEFYDTQINEELKYCNCSDFAITFTEIGRNKRAFIIRTKQEQTIVLLFKKSDYKGINEALEKIRLNLAVIEKENSLESSDDHTITISTTSKDEVSVKGKNGENKTLTISTVEQLLINDSSLKSSEDIIKRLYELSVRNDREEPYLDFYEAKYDAGIQNYLIMNLYQENIDLNDRLVNALVFYKMKEPKIFNLVKALLRGEFDEMYNYHKEINGYIDIPSVAKIAQNIIQAQEELPNRSHDIMIYRVEFRKKHNRDIGDQNTYETVISFGTSGGTLSEQPPEGVKPVVYKRILKKDEKAIPVDIIENLGLIYLDGTQENEFLLPPFKFQITGMEKEDQFDVYDIEETEKIDARELLNRRLDELEQYLRNKNDMEQYEKLKQSREKLTRRTKKTITGYNTKDIYYGLRPSKKKFKRVSDDEIDR